MQLKDIIHFSKCFTGRYWINIFSGWFAIGISTNEKRTRIMFMRKWVRY